MASNVLRVIATGSNTYDFRNDPQGVLGGVSKPALFQQAGYSHLNLYVRLLVLLEQLEPNEERLDELRWIADALLAQRVWRPRWRNRPTAARMIFGKVRRGSPRAGHLRSVFICGS